MHRTDLKPAAAAATCAPTRARTRARSCARTRNHKRALSVLYAALVLAALPILGGCGVGMLIGGVAENIRKSTPKTIEAEYEGLTDKSFVVLVTAPAVILAQYPELVQKITADVAIRVADNAGASGFVPPIKTLEYTFNRPSWPARPISAVASELGVQRVIRIEVIDYRLNDRGNSYIWDGTATASIAVVEADGSLPDDFAYQKTITVRFPDQPGFSQAEIPGPAVNSELTRRLVERASWLFYQHEEMPDIKY